MNTHIHPTFHGSDLEQIEKYYGIAKESIINFGANVNPLGLSPYAKERLVKNIDIITRYPDRDYSSLRQAIADYCNTEKQYVVVGNGSTELISLLISQRKTKHALVLGPTYSEYNRELSLTGGKISHYYLKESLDFHLDLDDFFRSFPDDIDLLIICNPNNPTSSAVPCSTLEKIAQECLRRNIFIMIDETYVEFAPCTEHITAIPLTNSFDNLIVIRGVSKFFAAPGLRLGYAITGNKDFLQTLKQHQNPWSLNSVGASVGEWLLEDTEYIKKTCDLVRSERTRILNRLNMFNYVKVYEAFANFVLVRITKEGLSSGDIFDYVIRQGFMIRDCASFDGLCGEYIRFCIMMPKDNDRLLDCLAELLAG